MDEKRLAQQLCKHQTEAIQHVVQDKYRQPDIWRNIPFAICLGSMGSVYVLVSIPPNNINSEKIAINQRENLKGEGGE